MTCSTETFLCHCFELIDDEAAPFVFDHVLKLGAIVF